MVDGAVVARAKIRQPLGRTPNEGLLILVDLGWSVVGARMPKFTGLMERARIFSGQAL